MDTNEEYKEFFKTNVRMLRERYYGLTQQEFADMCGVSRATVWCWEKHGVLPTVTTLMRVGTVLNVNPFDMLTKVIRTCY